MGVSNKVFIPLMAPDDNPLPDVADPEQVEIAFRALYQVLRDHKLDGFRVHLSIAGGRKSLSVFGMAAAQLLFR